MEKNETTEMFWQPEKKDVSNKCYKANFTFHYDFCELDWLHLKNNTQ